MKSRVAIAFFLEKDTPKDKVLLEESKSCEDFSEEVIYLQGYYYV